MKQTTRRLLAMLLTLVMLVSLCSVTAFAEPVGSKVIDKVEITGVVEPVVGATPQFTFTVPADAGYKIYTDAVNDCSSWIDIEGNQHMYASGRDGVSFAFEAGKTYSFRAWIQLKEGYKYADNVTVTVNGKTAGLSKGALPHVVYITFGPVKDPEKVIDKIEITGVVEPVVGATPEFTFTVPADAGYEIYTDEENDSSSWLEIGGKHMYASGYGGISFTFEAGKAYRFDTWIRLKEGYELADGVTATVNGKTATLDGGSLRSHVSITFGPLEAPEVKVIDKVEINGVYKPVVGNTVWDVWNIPDGGGYQKHYVDSRSCRIVKTDAEPTDLSALAFGTPVDLEARETFEADKYYSIVFYLDPKEGYVFSDTLNATVNGSDAHAVLSTGTDPYAACVWYCLGKSVAPNLVGFITVNNVTEPVVGNQSVCSYSFPANVGYTHYGAFDGLSPSCTWVETSVKPGSYADASEWEDFVSANGTAVGRVDSPLTFKDGYYYTLVIPVELKDETYRWADTVDGSLNGAADGIKAEFIPGAGPLAEIVTLTFVPHKSASNIVITDVQQPAAGAAISLTFTIPETEAYTWFGTVKEDAATWIRTTKKIGDDLDAFLHDGDAKFSVTGDFDSFEPGYYYTFAVSLYGHFTEGATASVNGKSASYLANNGINCDVYYTFDKLSGASEPEPVTYTVTATVEGGHGSVIVPTEPQAALSTVTAIFAPEEGYELDKVTVNGEEKGVLSNVLDIVMDGNKTVVATFKAIVYDYKIAKGDSQTITQGKEATFTSDAPFEKFVKVQVDGKDVDAANYTAKSGSTEITFKADYLKTLKTGKHTIDIVSKDGTASGSFTVKAVSAAAPTDKNNPKTGDENDLGVWVALMLLTGSSLAAFYFTCRKKRTE